MGADDILQFFFQDNVSTVLSLWLLTFSTLLDLFVGGYKSIPGLLDNLLLWRDFCIFRHDIPHSNP